MKETHKSLPHFDAAGLPAHWLHLTAGNRRVKKDFPGGSSLVDREYAYAGWQALEEYEAGQGNPKRQFVYGNYIDEPLAMDVNDDPGANATCIGGEDAWYFSEGCGRSQIGCQYA